MPLYNYSEIENAFATQCEVREQKFQQHADEVSRSIHSALRLFCLYNIPVYRKVHYVTVEKDNDPIKAYWLHRPEFEALAGAARRLLWVDVSCKPAMYEQVLQACQEYDNNPTALLNAQELAIRYLPAGEIAERCNILGEIRCILGELWP